MCLFFQIWVIFLNEFACIVPGIVQLKEIYPSGRNLRTLQFTFKGHILPALEQSIDNTE